MKKGCLALLLAAALLFSATALAEGAAVRVFDYAGLFTAAETEALEAAIAGFQSATGYDFAIFVSDVDHGYDDYQLLSDDFFAAKSLGLGMNRTAMLCILDLYDEAYYFVSPYGDFRYLMTNEDVQYLVETMMNHIYDHDLTGGFLWTMDITRLALSEIGVMQPDRRVYDVAGFLTETDAGTLEAAIADFRALSGYDFLYLSTDGEMDGNQEGDYMEEFYLSHGFGEGEAQSGAMVYLDAFTGNFYLQNFGDLAMIISNESLNGFAEHSKGLMGDSEILPAVLRILDDYAAYFR